MIDSPRTDYHRLDDQRLATLRARFLADPRNRTVQNALARQDVDEVAVDHEVLLSLRSEVSVHLDDWKVTNQYESGRCWLFAILNLLRADARGRLGVKDFEFSQTHAMYWDKLERANLLLDEIVATADQPLDGRLMSHLLAGPLEDGGQWDMAVSVLLRHGAVPKQLMPETYASSHSKHMNARLHQRLRRAALDLREVADDPQEVSIRREQALSDIHTILTVHLGTPPERVDWEWRDDRGDFHRVSEQPQEFLARACWLPLEEYVCLVDDPRPEHPKGALLTVEHLGNVVGGRPVRYLNVSSARMKKLAVQALNRGEPVWFGCDVAQQELRAEGRWAANLLDYEDVYQVPLTLTKEERVRTGESQMTHAMLLTGVDLADDETPLRWRVENSWGPGRGEEGFFVMADSWFDEYVFEVAVRRSDLDETERGIVDADAEVITLPAWDPMGALA